MSLTLSLPQKSKACYWDSSTLLLAITSNLKNLYWHEKYLYFYKYMSLFNLWTEPFDTHFVFLSLLQLQFSQLESSNQDLERDLEVLKEQLKIHGEHRVQQERTVGTCRTENTQTRTSLIHYYFNICVTNIALMKKHCLNRRVFITHVSCHHSSRWLSWRKALKPVKKTPRTSRPKKKR